MTIQEIEAARDRSDPVPQTDVVYARMRFPLTKTFFPLGFPLELSTNCAEVLDAAAESWRDFTQIFHTPPVRLQVGVLESGESECPPVPACRVQQHLFSFVADQQNFGVNDMASGFSFIWLTHAAVQHRSYLRYFFLECAAMSQIATRHATGVHAGCVSRNGVGVLLCGDSGAGKSTLSYVCANSGWTYITDDASYVVHGRDDLLVVGNCRQVRFRPSAESLFPEIRRRPIIRRVEVGKPSIEIGTSELSNLHCAPTTNIQHVVFLNRRLGRNESLRPYSKRVAKEFLCQGRFCPSDMVPAHDAAIDRLLQLEVLELRYRDSDWAIEQLNALAMQGCL